MRQHGAQYVVLLHAVVPDGRGGVALNLQPGAVDVRLAPNGPGDACRNGMTILAGQTLTLRAGEIRNLRITLGAGGLYLAPVADGY